MTILVASLIAPPFLDDRRRWGSWLNNAEAIKESVPGTEVKYYCAVELDGRGMGPYHDAGWVEMAELVGVHFETFTYDSGRTSVHTENRLKHICLGRNMIAHHASCDMGVTHIMGLDGDVSPPPDILPNLLAVDYPIVAANIPTYGFTGPRMAKNPRNAEQDYPPEWNVMQVPLASAGAWLIQRRVFNYLRWRVDYPLGMTDDPSYLYDATNLLRINPPILLRNDTIAKHWPESIGSIESRLTDPNLVAFDDTVVAH